MSKKKFAIMMPFTGSAYMEVEAENEDEAKQVFWDTAELVVDHKTTNVDVEIEFTEHVAKGNVSYAFLSEVDVKEI